MPACVCMLVHIYLVNVPPSGAQYCDEYVCLSVCLSNCLLSQIENLTAEFEQIFSACFLWPWLGRHRSTLRYTKYFRFCGCYFYNMEDNGPESSTTLYFNEVCQLYVTQLL